MKIVKMKGGLGNQMFQYSFAKFLERELNEEVKLDFHQYSNLIDDNIRRPRILKYTISLPFAEPSDCGFIFPHHTKPTGLVYKAGIYLENKLNREYYFTKGLTYESPESLSIMHYFDGYWQSHKYVKTVSDILQKEFVPNYSLNEKTLQIMANMSSVNSVFVGVRKGDYTKNKSMQASWGSFDESYYHSCMNYIKSKINNPFFLIFSNDVEWCKNNLDFSGYNYEYREKSEIVDDFEELQIMSSCKHAVIVNSTFNWWGAWLINNEDKIVCCPRSWYFNGQETEILPEEWIKF